MFNLYIDVVQKQTVTGCNGVWMGNALVYAGDLISKNNIECEWSWEMNGIMVELIILFSYWFDHVKQL